MPTPPQYRFVEGAAQAQSLADAPWLQVFDDPTLQALIREALANNLDLRVAVARVEEARARAGIAKSFLYPQVDGAASYGVAPGVERAAGRRPTTRTRRTRAAPTASSCRGRSICSAGSGARHEAALALVLASEQGRRGVLVTLVGDVASNYFLLRELDLQLEIARQTLRLNDETVTYFQNRLDGGVSNRLELDRIQANRAQTAAAIPDIEQQIAHRRERAVAAARPAAGADHARAARPPARRCRRRFPPGLPASLLERRPDVVAGRAVAGGGQRRHRRGQGAVLSDDQPDRVSRRRQRRSRRRFSAATARVWSLGAGLLAAGLPGRAPPPEPRGGAGALRRGARRVPEGGAQRLPRGGQRAGDDSEAGRGARCSGRSASTALQDASDLARARYDSGLASYIEILTADQELFEQQLLLAQTRGAELRARAELYRTLGGGWQP